MNIIFRIIDDDVHPILRLACSNGILHTLVAPSLMPMKEKNAIVKRRLYGSIKGSLNKK